MIRTSPTLVTGNKVEPYGNQLCTVGYGFTSLSVPKALTIAEGTLMEHEGSVSFPSWQHEYEAVLKEKDDASLWKRIEVAEAGMLVRLEAIKEGAAHRAERDALTGGLAHLAVLKTERLGFQK